jgi:putative ABC transport system substrate-binding protein
MRRPRGWLRLCSLCSLLVCAAPRGQEAAAARTWRCAVLLWHASPNDMAALEGIREAFADRRHPHEITVHHANESTAEAERILLRLAAERPDVIFAMGTQSALLARRSIVDIPIVFTAVTHPVESEVVTSWRGSGRNVAGNSNWIAPETVLHVFQMGVPHLRRLGVLRSAGTGLVSAAEVRDLRRTLALPGAPQIELVEEVVEHADDIPDAVGRMAKAEVQAVWVPIDFLIYRNMPLVTRAAGHARLPIVTSALQAAHDGATVGVVVDHVMLGKGAVVLALQILERGVDPGSLPVGTMRGYRVVVNLDGARRCGYELPLPLLALADVLHDSSARRAGEDARGR